MSPKPYWAECRCGHEFRSEREWLDLPSPPNGEFWHLPKEDGGGCLQLKNHVPGCGTTLSREVKR